MLLYRNNLKNREFDKEAPQNFRSERAIIAGRQGASENENFEEKPTQSKTDPSGCFDIYPFRFKRTQKDHIESSLQSKKKSGFILIQY
jgi:hypothetical protein